jgi:hypothetical protein
VTAFAFSVSIVKERCKQKAPFASNHDTAILKDVLLNAVFFRLMSRIVQFLRGLFGRVNIGEV